MEEEEAFVVVMEMVSEVMVVGMVVGVVAMVEVGVVVGKMYRDVVKRPNVSRRRVPP